MITTEEILEMLREEADPSYKEFNDKITNAPGMPSLGVRVPKLREIARKAAKDFEQDGKTGWMREMKDGRYPEVLEEHMLYGMAIGYYKAGEEERKILLDSWVPGILSWADCDSGVSTFKFMNKNPEYWFSYIKRWTKSDREMEVRFAVVAMIDFFLKEEYIDQVLEIYKKIHLDAYYVKMGIAWALSVCYIKYPEKTLPLFQGADLERWTHNKAIQKCRESYRVSKEEKAMLNQLKRK